MISRAEERYRRSCCSTKNRPSFPTRQAKGTKLRADSGQIKIEAFGGKLDSSGESRSRCKVAIVFLAVSFAFSISSPAPKKETIAEITPSVSAASQQSKNSTRERVTRTTP
jgi:hypothetical protein